MTVVQILPIITPWALFAAGLIVNLVVWVLARGFLKTLDEHTVLIAEIQRTIAAQRADHERDFVRKDDLKDLRNEIRGDFNDLRRDITALIRGPRQ